MKKIIISLGSNEGDRLQNLSTACDLLNEKVGKIESKSKIYETEPWGFESTSFFLNQVVLLNTKKTPGETMDIILALEQKMGRVRNKEKYSSRVIDIDILFYGNQIINSKRIEIPHPRLHLRKFILMPLVEIAPDFVHPIFGNTIGELLDECENGLEVKEYN